MPDWLTIQTYLSEYPATGWLAFAALCFVLEAAALPGIGLFFAGCGALSIGGLLAFDLVTEISFTTQLAWFFGCTSVWAALLWKPLKHFYNKAQSYDAFAGTMAKTKTELRAGKTGAVRWSGTDMRGRIAEYSETKAIAAGEDVWVHGRDGMVLMVDIAPPGKKDTE